MRPGLVVKHRSPSAVTLYIYQENETEKVTSARVGTHVLYITDFMQVS